MRRHELGDAPVRTIYLGGGTPSILSTDELNIIASLLPVSKLEEFTLRQIRGYQHTACQRYDINRDKPNKYRRAVAK